jgi:hypothetical protein
MEIILYGEHVHRFEYINITVITVVPKSLISRDRMNFQQLIISHNCISFVSKSCFYSICIWCDLSSHNVSVDSRGVGVSLYWKTNRAEMI